MIIKGVNYTKVDVKKIIQNILNNCEINIWLDKENKEILIDLLKNHEDYYSKVGCGIKGFKIKYNSWNQKSFYLYRVDGSSTDFSYLACLNPQTLNSLIKSACRNAIKKDIISFKIRKFEIEKITKSEISNEEVSFNNCEVDHFNPTFKEIFKEWIKNKNVTRNDISPSKDNCETIFFNDNKLRDDFRIFHNELSNLRIITHKENMELVYKKEDDTKTTTT